jgi:hypothetical protein
MSKDLSFRQRIFPIKHIFYFIYLDGLINNIDDAHPRQQQPSPAAHFSKRKASFR